MKRMLVLLCLSLAVMPGCSRTQTQTSALQDRCSAGSAAACEELARVQQSSYAEQEDSALRQSRPMIPTPASAVPPANHFP